MSIELPTTNNPDEGPQELISRSPFPVKPLSVNISVKPKQLISQVEYNLTCTVNGSVPDTEIKWTQNNRPFKRGQVRLQFSSEQYLRFDVSECIYQ